MTLELFMYLTRIAFNGITGIAVAILSACAAQQKPVELKPEPATAQQQMTGVQALQRPMPKWRNSCPPHSRAR